MMSDLTVFEAGIKTQSGKYYKFIESNLREEIEDYIEIMKATRPENSEILFLEKNYVLISTTPHLCN